MLDVQRYKGSPLRKEVHFTRLSLWSHLALGFLVVMLLLMHELFFWAAAACTWYFLTILLVAGILSATSSCRELMAAAGFLFAIVGIYFIGQVKPNLQPLTPPFLPYAFLPFWLGAANILYAAGGVLFLNSTRIRKACLIGFKLV